MSGKLFHKSRRPSPSASVCLKMPAKRTQSARDTAHVDGSSMRGADVVYTDVWVSMGQESDRSERLSVFGDYQVGEELMGYAKADAIFMHDMPAHRGEEVSDTMLNDPRSVVFDQAENRMWAQMSILTLLCDRAAWETYAELMEID